MSFGAPQNTSYSSDIDPASLKCVKCDKKLELKKTTLNYLGRTFSVEVPCCPVCGQTYITPELAEGKIASVEMLLEDK